MRIQPVEAVEDTDEIDLPSVRVLCEGRRRPTQIPSNSFKPALKFIAEVGRARDHGRCSADA
jgi:hypothetical protein